MFVAGTLSTSGCTHLPAARIASIWSNPVLRVRYFCADQAHPAHDIANICISRIYLMHIYSYVYVRIYETYI